MVVRLLPVALFAALIGLGAWVLWPQGEEPVPYRENELGVAELKVALGPGPPEDTGGAAVV